MAKFRSQKLLFYFFFPLFSIILMGGIEGLVLCFGADGHIHIETTFNGYDCGHYPTHSSTKSTSYCSLKNTHHAKSHCNSCIDIPLSIDYSLQKIIDTTRYHSSQVTPPLISAFLYFPSYTTNILSQSLSLKIFENILPILNSIECVVLLL